MLRRCRSSKRSRSYCWPASPSPGIESSIRRRPILMCPTPGKATRRAEDRARGRAPAPRDLAASLLAALLLLAIAEQPGAEADGPDFFQVVGVASDDLLNIRAEPSPRARKLGTIPPDGKCVRNLGCRGGLTFEEFTTLSATEQALRLRESPRWCRIEYKGMSGWVAGRYLAEGGCHE